MISDEAVAILVVAVLGFWILGAYNRLVRMRQTVTAAFVQVDLFLRERNDLLAELVQACSGWLPDTPEAADAIEAARRQTRVAADHALKSPVNAGRLASLVLTEQMLQTAVTRLLTIVKTRPALRTDPALRAQLKNLSTTQHRLSAARHAFNATVLDYNHSVRQFPTRLVARIFGFGVAGRL